ncbi:MAG: STAS domain-containing protein [Rhodospirillales bacterium]|nr:STAS domain-containing protein [Rhodospirillales bacterium]
MNHEVEIRDGCTYVHFRVEIDLSCSAQVRQILLDVVGKYPLTVVELSGVSVIDSSGIASLLDGRQVAKRRGHSFELAAPSPQVMRVLGLAQLDRFFIIRDH